MKRRTFIQQTFRAAMAAPFLRLPAYTNGMRMGIVVHSYAIRWNSKTESLKYPGFKDAIDLMEHCHGIGAGGVQVNVRDWAPDFVKNVRDRREKLGLFLEGSIGLPKSAADVQKFQEDILAAKEAGADVIRTVCLSGRRYENFRTLPEFQEFSKKAIASLELAEKVVRRHKVKLAIENHKDWRAPELAGILKNLGSEWVGVNLDFGNNIALIEDPMAVVNSLAPFAFTTHVKDINIRKYNDGFLLSEVPLGEGVLDLKKMFGICRQHRADIKFNLEMITRDPLKIPCLTNDFWATLPDVSPNELASTLRLVRKNPFRTDLPVISPLSAEHKLITEEQNILTSLAYGRTDLGLK